MVNGLSGRESMWKRAFSSCGRFFVSKFCGRFPVFQLRSDTLIELISKSN